MIYILGLGPNDINGIKEEIKNIIFKNKDKFFVVRTKEHPAVKFLDSNKIAYVSCDKFYVESDEFFNTYKKIADYILEEAINKDVFYLVPGHPMVAELTTKLIVNSTEDVRVLGGESFLDSCFNAAKFDPVEGFMLLDATDLESLQKVNPQQHILITQCYDDLTAGDILLEIGDYYPENHKVTVMESVGGIDEKIYYSTLGDLQFDVGEEVNNLRTIYIPPFKEAVNFNIKRLIPEFSEGVTNVSLANDIEKSLAIIKSGVSDDIAVKELANILKTTLNFTNSEDGYYYLEDILKEL